MSQLLMHAGAHTGEIAVTKGLQRLQGYPSWDAQRGGLRVFRPNRRGLAIDLSASPEHVRIMAKQNGCSRETHPSL